MSFLLSGIKPKREEIDMWVFTFDNGLSMPNHSLVIYIHWTLLLQKSLKFNLSHYKNSYLNVLSKQVHPFNA
jgi:hypothetical protein